MIFESETLESRSKA